MSNDSDLSLATTDELLAELKNRSETLVVGIDPKADQGTYKIYRQGSRLVAAGLIRNLMLESDAELLAGGNSNSSP